MNEQSTRFVAEVRKGRSTDAAGTAVGATPQQVSEWLANDVVQKAIAAKDPQPVAKPEEPKAQKRTPRKREPRKRVQRKK